MLTPQELRELGPDDLAVVLSRRADVLSPVSPRSLGELAARLDHSVSLALALHSLNTPQRQVAQALAALGANAHRERLDALLGAHGETERQVVDTALNELAARLLLRVPPAPDGANGVNGLKGVVQLIEQAAILWRRPLGLGPSLHTLLPQLTVTTLYSALRALGRQAPTRKAEQIRKLTTILTDPEQVQRAVKNAPGTIGERLLQVALNRQRLVDTRFGGIYRSTPDPVRREVELLNWATERLLLVSTGWSGELLMPAEVALILRGPDWRAPFDPVPPPVTWTPTAPEMVLRESVVAGAHALRTVAAVLQQIGVTPMPLLKNGGVGVREIRRIAKAVGCQVFEVRLSLALGVWADLLGVDGDRVTPTLALDQWLADVPGEQLATLVAAWLELPETPLLAPDGAWNPHTDPRTVRLRPEVLTELAHHQDAAPSTVESLADWARWQVPSASPYEDLAISSFPNGDDHEDGDGPAASEVPDLVRAILAEAAWLGIVGCGALSPAGRAAVLGDDVAAAVGASLGQPEQTARLQADLTAVVLGHPSGRLVGVLDQLADRETSSVAAIWRFSPASIRRAMDAGSDEAGIQQMLAAIAVDQVPQPLRYLVRDVARRHGALRAGELSSYLRCDDPALLAEIEADRSLRRLELRRIAPSVLGSGVTLAALLAGLRSAGYLPVAEDAAGAVLVERQQSKRVRTPVPAPPPPREQSGIDYHQAAQALLAGPDKPVNRLIDVGSDVIDMGSLEELLSMLDEED